MLAVRYLLPLAIFVAGCLIWAIRGDTTGLHGFAMATGAALSVLMINVMFRLGVAGDREREAEQSARDHLAEHGRWPDEAGGADQADDAVAADR